MDRLGIEMLSVFGLPPVEHVKLAADLGCAYISTGLTAFASNPHGYPAWSLRDDAALRREMKAALRDYGVTIGLGEGVVVRRGSDVRERAADLDLLAELGAARVSTLGMDPDLGRTLDQLAALVALAEERGMATTLEFAPRNAIGDLAGALAAIRHVGRPHFRLLVDAMHLLRSGGRPADLAALDPDLIGYAQLCDVPFAPPHSNYMKEAMFERLDPGAGDVPLLDLLAVLPPQVPLGLEVPKLAQAEAGVGPYERLRPCVESIRQLLRALEDDAAKA